MPRRHDADAFKVLALMECREQLSWCLIDEVQINKSYKMKKPRKAELDKRPSDEAPSPTRMFTTENDLPKKQRKELNELMNQRLADAVDLQMQMKQAHWNVKGPNFIALHELFDKVAEGVESYVDLIAERIVQLGGTAEGRIKQICSLTCLEEYPGKISEGRDHVEAVVRALASFGHEVRSTIDEATELNDPGSADLFTEVSRGIDKWLWFVEAHAQATK